MPKYINSALIGPLPCNSTFHAYTRIRNDVQNGNTTSISNVLRHGWRRARDAVRHRITDQQRNQRRDERRFEGLQRTHPDRTDRRRGMRSCRWSRSLRPDRSDRFPTADRTAVAPESGSDSEIFRTSMNGIRKNSVSHKYGAPMTNRRPQRGAAISAKNQHSRSPAPTTPRPARPIGRPVTGRASGSVAWPG